MIEPWYQVVAPDKPLSQGDIILGCPVLAWLPSHPHASPTPSPPLEERATVLSEDVIVMTQACDLEQRKVHDVVLCRHFPLTAYRKNDWERWMTDRGQTPSEKSWRRFCEDIAAGYVWNLSFLDRFEHAELGTEVRIVNFHKVFTVPRDFMESLSRERRCQRLRLCSPYREHLSQAFARFFMRVGLPQPVTVVW
jgi:hypothetical protein